MTGFGPVLAASHEDIGTLFGANVFGALGLIQLTVPHMPPGGRIINIGSIASRLGIKNLGLYGASKATMAALTYSLAQEVSWLCQTVSGTAILTTECSSVRKRASRSTPLLQEQLIPTYFLGIMLPRRPWSSRTIFSLCRELKPGQPPRATLAM